MQHQNIVGPRYMRMGVRRLFTSGGQNFPGGHKHTICQKNAYKHTILAIQGGQAPLLPSPADTHVYEVFYLQF